MLVGKPGSPELAGWEAAGRHGKEGMVAVSVPPAYSMDSPKEQFETVGRVLVHS